MMLRTPSTGWRQRGRERAVYPDKMRIYELMNDPKAAYQGIEVADSRQHPLDMIYKTMLGNWLMQHNRQKEAYKFFTDVLKEEPDNAYAQMSLYDYYNATNQKEQAHRCSTGSCWVRRPTWRPS